jgi:hypothetical protein
VAAKLSLKIKEAGGLAFAGCFSRGTYDVLMDDQLFAELATLWDCATLAELNARVLQSSYPRAAEAFLQAVCTQTGGPVSRAKPNRPPPLAPAAP